jgi:hypothetical protein
MNRYLQKKGCIDDDGNRVLLVSDIRAVNTEIDTLEVPLKGNTFNDPKLHIEAEANRKLALNEARVRLKALESQKENKDAAWKKFKQRLNITMFEICIELWRIWFGLSNLTEEQKKKLNPIDDAHFESQNEASIIKYTVNSDMEDFQQLITTYKSKFNTRKTADLPKNALEAKKKHEELKAIWDFKVEDASGEY